MINIHESISRSYADAAAKEVSETMMLTIVDSDHIDRRDLEEAAYRAAHIAVIRYSAAIHAELNVINQWREHITGLSMIRPARFAL